MAGYTGTCNATCNASVWNINTNTCALIPGPDLDPISFAAPGPYIKDRTIQLSGVVENIGGVTTGVGFNDEFSYKWDISDPWTVLNTLPHGALGPGSTANDGPRPLTLTQTGPLYLQYCVDSGPGNGAVDEGANEIGNCIVLGPLNVVEPTGTIDAVTPVNIGGTSIVTWNTQNTTGTCDIDGNNGDSWTGQALNNPVMGLTTQSLNADATYTLECDGVLLDFVTITVNEVDITATPRLVNVGTQTTITYDPVGQVDCLLTGGGLNLDVDAAGFINHTINAQTTFTLTCLNGVDSTTVDVVPVGFET